LRRRLFLQLLVDLFLLLIDLGAGGPHGRFVFASLRSGALQALFGQLAGAFGGLVPLLQDFFEGLKSRSSPSWRSIWSMRFQGRPVEDFQDQQVTIGAKWASTAQKGGGRIISDGGVP
jgi:hypothetical protein